MDRLMGRQSGVRMVLEPGASMGRGATERAQIAQKLGAKGYHHFTLSRPQTQLSGPPQARLVLTRDALGKEPLATLSGTYPQLLQDIERLPNLE